MSREKLPRMFCEEFTDKFSKDVALRFAAEFGYLQELRQLLAMNSNVNEPNRFGRTPLHFVSENGDIQAIRLLLSAKADVTLMDNYGSTPLHLALAHQRADAVTTLVAAKADDMIRDSDGSTLLHLAAESGDVSAVKLLLTAEAEVLSRRHDGATPLHLAASNGQMALVFELLQAEAPVMVFNESGASPLHLSVAEDKEQVSGQLLAAGADPLVKDHRGKTPLQIAALRENLAILKRLLAAVVWTESIAINNDETTTNPSHTSFEQAMTSIEPEMRSLLNKRQDSEDLLTKAVLDGEEYWLRVLLFMRVNPDATRGTGIYEEPALHLALHCPESRIIKLLLEYSADPNLKNGHGEAPLHVAVRDKNAIGMEFLLNSNADMNAYNTKYSFTPLHRAVIAQFVEGVKILVRRKADPNIQDIHKRTPLHIVLDHRYVGPLEDMVRHLLIASPIVTIPDENGQTVLGMVDVHSKNEVLKPLFAEYSLENVGKGETAQKSRG